jgi:hypothetical protein
MNSQLGRTRARGATGGQRRQAIRRGRRVEALAIRVLNALAQRGRSPQAEVDAGRAVCCLLDVEGVGVEEVVGLCLGELDAAEIERLCALAALNLPSPGPKATVGSGDGRPPFVQVNGTICDHR